MNVKISNYELVLILDALDFLINDKRYRGNLYFIAIRDKLKKYRKCGEVFLTGNMKGMDNNENRHVEN